MPLRSNPAIVARRVDLPGALLGFTPAPPCQVHLKFLPSGDRWTLLGLVPPGMPPRVAEWLQAFRPSVINIAPGITPRILRAQFDELPAAWLQLVSTVIVHSLELTPEGSASVFVEDSPAKVAAFIATIPDSRLQVRERKSQSSPERVKLTARQLEVMSLAVALGYYETPHKLNLRLLAQKLGLSVGAVSELLRRGESLIVTNYIDSLSESEWADTADANGGRTKVLSPSH